MGYMEITIVGSDTASDLNWSVAGGRSKKPMSKPDALKLLRKELTEDHSVYNTHGCVNVSLILTDEDEGAGHKLFKDEREGKETPYAQDYRRLVIDTLAMMKKLRAAAAKAEWDNEEGKRYHLETYDALIKAMNKV